MGILGQMQESIDGRQESNEATDATIPCGFKSIPASVSDKTSDIFSIELIRIAQGLDMGMGGKQANRSDVHTFGLILGSSLAVCKVWDMLLAIIFRKPGYHWLRIEICLPLLAILRTPYQKNTTLRTKQCLNIGHVNKIMVSHQLESCLH